MIKQLFKKRIFDGYSTREYIVQAYNYDEGYTEPVKFNSYKLAIDFFNECKLKDYIKVMIFKNDKIIKDWGCYR